MVPLTRRPPAGLPAPGRIRRATGDALDAAALAAQLVVDLVIASPRLVPAIVAGDRRRGR